MPTMMGGGVHGRARGGEFGGPGETYVGSGGTDEEVESDPGFWINIEGRLLFGTTQTEAFRFFDEVLYPRLRALSQQGGWGFYIPEKDPKNTQKVEQPNLREPTIRPTLVSASPFAQGPGPRGARGGAIQIGQPEADAEQSVALPDPVTGEDMSTDWLFAVGFKVKLGEPPASETGEDTAQE
jgi:hypothetical protein